MVKQEQEQQKENRRRHRMSLDRQLLQEKFASPIIISKYDGMHICMKVEKVFRFIMHADMVKDNVVMSKQELRKIECLFAVPAEKWTDVKPHITRNKSVAELELKAEEKLARRDMFNDKLPSGVPCKVCLRNGLVLNGIIGTEDKFHLLMRVGGKVVLVWKHAVHEIKITGGQQR